MQASLRLAPLSEDEVRFAVAETRRWSGGKQLVFYEVDLLESISTEAKTAVLGGDWEALAPALRRYLFHFGYLVLAAPSRDGSASSVR